MTQEQAIQNIDKALASISANRETHLALQISLQVLTEKAKEADILKTKVEELKTLQKAK